MIPLPTSVVDLPDGLAAEAARFLVAADERHFAVVAESLRRSTAQLSDRLDVRRAPGGAGQGAPGRPGRGLRGGRSR